MNPSPRHLPLLQVRSRILAVGFLCWLVLCSGLHAQKEECKFDALTDQASSDKPSEEEKKKKDEEEENKEYKETGLTHRQFSQLLIGMGGVIKSLTRRFPSNSGQFDAQKVATAMDHYVKSKRTDGDGAALSGTLSQQLNSYFTLLKSAQTDGQEEALVGYLRKFQMKEEEFEDVEREFIIFIGALPRIPN